MGKQLNTTRHLCALPYGAPIRRQRELQRIRRHNFDVRETGVCVTRFREICHVSAQGIS